MSGVITYSSIAPASVSKSRGNSLVAFGRVFTNIQLFATSSILLFAASSRCAVCSASVTWSLRSRSGSGEGAGAIVTKDVLAVPSRGSDLCAKAALC